MSPDIYLDCHSELGECPIWDPRTESIWWVDIHRAEVLQYVPARGWSGISTHRFDAPVGSIALQPNGHLVVALGDHFIDYDPTERRQSLIARIDVGRPGVRLNDGRCDPNGRFVCGGMNMSDSGERPASVHCLDADGKVRTIIEGIDCANSICFSPEGSRMYFSDMPTGAIQAFDYDTERGVASKPSLFAGTGSAQGLPDGSITDADGCVWNARWGAGQVVRYSPDGRVDRIITLPVSNVSCVAFGGPRLSTLFITTAHYGLSDEERLLQPQAGSIFAIDPGVKGISEAHYIRG